jgi:hypothetical protein
MFRFFPCVGLGMRGFRLGGLPSCHDLSSLSFRHISASFSPLIHLAVPRILLCSLLVVAVADNVSQLRSSSREALPAAVPLNGTCSKDRLDESGQSSRVCARACNFPTFLTIISFNLVVQSLAGSGKYPLFEHEYDAIVVYVSTFL